MVRRIRWRKSECGGAGLAGAALALALFTASCGASPSGRAGAGPPPEVAGLVTTLEDEVQDLGDGWIKWSTYWKLCWDHYPGAKAYELQAVTSEGRSPKLGRLGERCLRIQAASNVNRKSQGMHNRDTLLALQWSQLAYRVRAVLEDGRTSAWSSPVAAGKVP